MDNSKSSLGPQQERFDLEAALQQAVAFQQQERWADAEHLYKSILSRNPDNFDALYLFGLLKLQTGRAAEAANLAERALKQRPRSLKAISNMAAALTSLDRDEEALKYYDELVAIHPANFDAHYNRGVVLTKLGRLDQALLSYQEALAGNPNNIEALFNRANVLAQLDRYEEALTTYGSALVLAPNLVHALNNRGRILAKLGRHQAALADFDRAVMIKPNFVDALCNKGATLNQIGYFEQSLDCYNKALAADPRHLNSLLNRGNLLLAMNRLSEALASYDSTLAIDPCHVDALSARCVVLLKLDRMKDAAISIERAVILKPEDAKLLNLRAHVFESFKQFDLALCDYHAVLAIEPTNVTAISGIAACLIETCAWDETEAAIGKVAALVEQDRAVSPMQLLRTLDDPAKQLRCARNYVSAAYPSPPVALKEFGRIRSEKIRIAYLSPDFRTHPLAFLVPDLFERHDRSKFEITAISFGPKDDSEVRSRIVGAVDHFHHAMLKSDYEVATLMREKGIDIAVDLATHTAHAHFGVFSYRAAPIQVNYLGYCGTSGANFIDYIIADSIVLPFEHQPFYTEAIVHVPDCFMVNDSKQKMGKTPTRSDIGLPAEGFVFCCFNKSYKYTSPIFDIWAHLLAKLDGSVLWLSADNKFAKESLRDAAVRRNVDPQRIIFADRVTRREDHLARIQVADLFLDTSPYNAHSTASDALWAGLPLVTCLGQCFAGRVGASLLNAVGLPELVTTSLADYEEVALNLASDRIRLASIRNRLSIERLAFPLFNTVHFTAHIESAFTTMWERWKRGETPAAFAVERIV